VAAVKGSKAARTKAKPRWDAVNRLSLFSGSTERRARIGFAGEAEVAAGFLGLSENLRVPINDLARLALSTVAAREIWGLRCPRRCIRRRIAR
jgi:hypothetical protein